MTNLKYEICLAFSKHKQLLENFILDHMCIDPVMESHIFIEMKFTTKATSRVLKIDEVSFLFCPSRYLSQEDVLDQSNPFVQLVSGVIWLLRDGEPYINFSLEAECNKSQETGTNSSCTLGLSR